jgi:hypothetical protein
MTVDWVSQTLVNTYNSYKTACSNARTSYNKTLSTLKTKNAELTVLKASLKDLESLKSAQEEVMGTSVSLHGRVPVPSDSDYTIYQNAVTLVNTYITQIVTKESEITLKQNEIASLQTTLDAISNSIDESNYFTTEQLAEMNTFIYEGEDFEDSTYVITSETSEEEALTIKTELMQSVSDRLAIISKPNYTFNIKASNLYTIQDDKDELISYSEWREQLKVGSLITLFINSTWMTVRLMSIIIDFDNPEEIELKFSTKSRLDDELIQLAEILADSGRAASTLSLKQFGYDAASKLVNQAREFINGTLNATTNAMINNDNVETEFGKFGIKNRQWLPDQNKYSDYQSWWNQNTLLFTSDGFKTSDTAIGLLTAPDGQKYYGLATDVIVGNLIIGSKLNISNNSGTYSWDDNGMIASAVVGANTYSVGINPSTINVIFNIKLDGIKKFYIDTDTNRLVMDGQINSTSGNIGGWEISTDGLTSYNTGTSINLYNQNNHAMELSYSGLHLYNHYSGTNEYLGGAIATYNSSNGTNGLVFQHSADAEYLAIGYADSTYQFSGMPIYLDMIYTRNGYLQYTQGFHFFKPVSIYSGLTVNGTVDCFSLDCSTINGGTPITTANKDNYTFAPSYHSHTEYVTTDTFSNTIAGIYQEINSLKTGA